MFTGLGIALMIVMMGGMMLGGHKMMKGDAKRADRSAAQAPVSVSSSAAPGVEPAQNAHQH